MKFEVNEKVYAFTMLLFGQQLFLQMFDNQGKLDDSEFGLIKPIIKELYEGLTEEQSRAVHQTMFASGFSMIRSGKMD